MGTGVLLFQHEHPNIYMCVLCSVEPGKSKRNPGVWGNLNPPEMPKTLEECYLMVESLVSGEPDIVKMKRDQGYYQRESV